MEKKKGGQMKGVSMWETFWNLHSKLCDTDNYFNFSYELLVITVNGISLMVL